MQLNPSIFNTILAGSAGGLALNLVALLSFRFMGFGYFGGNVLLDLSAQGQKSLALWVDLEPVSLMYIDPAVFITGLVVFSVIHAFIYNWLSPHWTAGIVNRGVRLAAIVFTLSFLSWEFFGAYNLVGLSAGSLVIQSLCWTVASLAEGLAIAGVMELRLKNRKETTSTISA